MYERYFDAVDGILRKVRDANRESIPRAASLMADTIAADGIIHAFGSGHSQLLAIELAGRAGGLAAMQVILDPGQGKAETIEGYAATLLRDFSLESRDCLIVISNSGRNPSPIEMAMLGRERGLPVIAVTAADFSRSVSSRHSSGKRLLDVADVVLDTCGAAGDAAVELDGVAEAIRPQRSSERRCSTQRWWRPSPSSSVAASSHRSSSRRTWTGRQSAMPACGTDTADGFGA